VRRRRATKGRVGEDPKKATKLRRGRERSTYDSDCFVVTWKFERPKRSMEILKEAWKKSK